MHWSQTQFLEGHSSAQFSSNQLQITTDWSFLVILKTLISWIRCVWLGLELNCAELWPSRNWVWDQWRNVYNFFANAACNFCHQVSVFFQTWNNETWAWQHPKLISTEVKKIEVLGYFCHIRIFFKYIVGHLNPFTWLIQRLQWHSKPKYLIRDFLLTEFNRAF